MASTTQSLPVNESSEEGHGPWRNFLAPALLGALTLIGGAAASVRQDPGSREPAAKAVPADKETHNKDFGVYTREFCGGALKVIESHQSQGLLDVVRSPKFSTIRLKVCAPEGQPAPDSVELVAALAAVLSEPGHQAIDSILFTGNFPSGTTTSLFELLASRGVSVHEVKVFNGFCDQECIGNLSRLSWDIKLSRLHLLEVKFDVGAARMLNSSAIKFLRIDDSPMDELKWVTEMSQLDRLSISATDVATDVAATDALKTAEAISALVAQLPKLQPGDWSGGGGRWSFAFPESVGKVIREQIETYNREVNSGRDSFTSSVTLDFVPTTE